MAVEEEIAGLLEAALTIDKERDETKQQIESKRRESALTEDQVLATTAENGKKLGTRVDELLARMTVAQDELYLLKREQEACAEKQLAALNTAGETTKEVRESLLRMHTMLAVKRNPDAEMLTPPITFTVANFEGRKANDESWISRPFYSHPMGYRMCLRVYLNGNGNGHGTHISAYVVIQTGEFDDLLSWPFCGKITIQLLNQRKSSRGHISKLLDMTSENSLHSRHRIDPMHAAQVGVNNLPCWGFPQYAANNDVCGPRGYFAATEYLKEDKLVFRVWKVDTFFFHH